MVKVLVMGEEHRITGALARYFNRQGYSATTAGTCEEAIWLLEREPFDVVITDLSATKKKTSGPDIISHLRNNFPLTGVIAISGKYNHGEIEDVDYFFEKPFLLHDVEKAVKTFAKKTLPF